VLFAPKECEGGAVIDSIVTCIEENLAGSHLKFKIFYARVEALTPFGMMPSNNADTT
jgi:hypothetical protein